jgi:hypothetical protein
MLDIKLQQDNNIQIPKIKFIQNLFGFCFQKSNTVDAKNLAKRSRFT